MKTNKRWILLLICVVIFIFGISAVLYPLVSSWYSDSVRSEIHTQYQETIAAAENEDLTDIRNKAQEFNQQLFAGEIDPLDSENNGYYEQLDVAGNGIMGHITIPKLNLTLPVYHGTSDKVLKLGAGHMPQSSLPVGGINTHSVISAHTGMASNPMFSDLELLEIGDLFQIEVLDEILTYRVYNIPEPVLPHEIDAIQIRSGKDLCTLITCTPYGVNTHRLLVQGERIPTPEVMESVPEEDEVPEEKTESLWMQRYYQSILIGLCVALVLTLLFLVSMKVYITLRKKNSNEEK